MTIPLSFRHRWGGALGAAFFLGLALLFAAVVFLRPENFLLAGCDYQSHQFFLKTFLADSFRAGELPLWMPYICAGRPFAADPQSGVFYPPHLLYAVLSVPWATTLLVILHLAAAGFFCCLLTRELGLSRFAASLSGVVFMFNGFLVTHGYRGQLDPLETIAYLPLMFFLVERAQRRGRPGCYLWLGLAGALQILAGAPQIAWLTWVGLGVYLLARRLCFWKPGGVRALARSVGGGLLALAFTAGLAAVQILPTAELVGESSRSKGSIEFSATYAFAPQKVIHLFFPNYFLDPPIEDFNNEAESSAYVGLLGMALALLGLLRYQCRLKWALLVVALVNIFIMLGQATPVFGILYHLIPGFSSFRLPSRAVLMLTLCLSVYAGMGAEAIWNRSGDTRTRKLAIVLAVSLLLAMIPMAYHLAQFARRSVFEVSALWSALALAVLVLAALLLSWLRPQRWIQAAWLAFICLDVFFVGATADRYRVFESQVFRPPASEKNVIRQMRDDPGL